ncbi:YheT family hydrolase, partial [Caballeronia sp.]|uniref:YheT family hydrolase n=1 Tax=Caballeronia sp. TaxID=1931223 RepID=UPI003C57EB49
MKRDIPHPSELACEPCRPPAAIAQVASSGPGKLREPLTEWLYRAPLWLPSAHAQTIVPALFARRPAVSYTRERWTTPDDDFIDLDWLSNDGDSTAAPASTAPLFVLFHGLEGSSDSHYARVLMAEAKARGWHGVVPHFRSCSGPMNLLPRFYHLADSAEVDWVLRRLRARHAGPIFAAGVSLGGNVLLRWLCEQREDASLIDAAAAISAPLDVHAGGDAI